MVAGRSWSSARASLRASEGDSQVPGFLPSGTAVAFLARPSAQVSRPVSSCGGVGDEGVGRQREEVGSPVEGSGTTAAGERRRPLGSD
jgi:hypothetical protein